jgi:hypothetical protein
MSRPAIALAKLIGLDATNVIAFNIRARREGVTVTVQKHILGVQASTQRFSLTPVTPQDQADPLPPALTMQEGGQK